MSEPEPPCSHDPMQPPYSSLGMYHCPECGQMVVGLFPHPDYSIEPTAEDFERWAAEDAERAARPGYDPDEEIPF